MDATGSHLFVFPVQEIRRLPIGPDVLNCLWSEALTPSVRLLQHVIFFLFTFRTRLVAKLPSVYLSLSHSFYVGNFSHS